jgi:TonB family protein
MGSPQAGRVDTQTSSAGALRWSVSGVNLDFAFAPGALADIRNDLKHRKETAWGLLLGSAGAGKDGGRFVTVHESVPLGSDSDAAETSLLERVTAVEDLVMGWSLSEQLPVPPVGFYVVRSRAAQSSLERELPALAKYGREQPPLVFCIRPASEAGTTPALIAVDPLGGGTAELPVGIDFSSEWNELPPAAPEVLRRPQSVTDDVPQRPTSAARPAPLSPAAQRPGDRRPAIAPGDFTARTWVAIAAAAVVLVAAGWWLAQRRGVLTPSPARTAVPSSAGHLDMHVVRRGGDLEITWSRTSPVVQAAQRGFLDIVDGGERTQVFLEEAHLKTGRVLYVPRSGQVEVRLEVITPEDRVVRESLKVITASSGAVAPTGVTLPGAEPQQQRSTASPRNAAPQAAEPNHEAARQRLSPETLTNRPPEAEQSATIEAPRKVFVAPAQRASTQPVGTARIESIPDPSVGVASLNSAPILPQTGLRVPAPAPPAAAPQPAPERPRNDSAPAQTLPNATPYSPFEPPAPTRQVPVQVPTSVRAAVRGEVSVPVTVMVDEKGKVTSARALAQGSSLMTYLAAAAKTAAEQWRFRPAARNGAPVAAEYTIVFKFAQSSGSAAR